MTYVYRVSRFFFSLIPHIHHFACFAFRRKKKQEFFRSKPLGPLTKFELAGTSIRSRSLPIPPTSLPSPIGLFSRRSIIFSRKIEFSIKEESSGIGQDANVSPARRVYNILRSHCVNVCICVYFMFYIARANRRTKQKLWSIKVYYRLVTRARVRTRRRALGIYIEKLTLLRLCTSFKLSIILYACVNIKRCIYILLNPRKKLSVTKMSLSSLGAIKIVITYTIILIKHPVN